MIEWLSIKTATKAGSSMGLHASPTAAYMVTWLQSVQWLSSPASSYSSIAAAPFCGHDVEFRVPPRLKSQELDSQELKSQELKSQELKAEVFRATAVVCAGCWVQCSLASGDTAMCVPVLCWQRQAPAGGSASERL